MLQIYTDGAYKSSIDQGGIGVVWVKNNEVFKKYSKGFKHTTNNKMELIAMLCAFKSIKTPMDEVEFISDSQYVLGCLTMGWKKKKNVELWNILDKEYEKVKSLVKILNLPMLEDIKIVLVITQLMSQLVMLAQNYQNNVFSSINNNCFAGIAIYVGSAFAVIYRWDENNVPFNIVSVLILVCPIINTLLALYYMYPELTKL